MHQRADAEQRALDARELQEALEQGCDALVVMLASSERIAGRGELDGVRSDLAVAIASLRSAIAELRQDAARAGRGTLAGGFVLAAGSGPGSTVQVT